MKKQKKKKNNVLDDLLVNYRAATRNEQLTKYCMNK